MNQESVSQPDLALSDLLPMYRRRSAWIWRIALAFVALAAVYCAVCTPKYDSTGIVEVKRENTDALKLESLNGSESGAVDALSTGMDLETESNILQSDTLALKTIERLGLEHAEDFRPRWNPIGWISGVFGSHPQAEPSDLPLDQAPVRRARLLKIFSKNLKVKVESGSRLIEITYRSADPRVAANVVNSLIQGLTDYSFETRLNATSEASQWLTNQLSDLRQQSETLQAKVLRMQQGMGVYASGGTDAMGNPQVYSSILDHLQQATNAMTAAKANRILKQAIYENVRSGNPDLISGLAGNAGGQGSSINNSLALIQSLREQQATLQQQIDSHRAKFGEAYPTLKEEESALAGVEGEIGSELARIGARAKSDYEVARSAEATTLTDYDAIRKQAEALSNKGVEVTIDRQESDNMRSLYEDLLKRLKEAGILEGWRSSNIAVVDPGRVPSEVAKPKVLLYLAIALIGGLFFGVGAAFLIDNLDARILSVEQVAGEFPLLGTLPLVRDRRGPKSVKGVLPSQSPLLAALRNVRISLMLGNSSTQPRTVFITSVTGGEGKTTFATNLANLLARQGRKVLLVDMDLRRPSQPVPDQAATASGLNELLLLEDPARTGQEFVRAAEGVANLSVLPAGNTSDDRVELLGAPRMQHLLNAWRATYDVVLLDSPPVLEVTDAIPLAVLADTAVLIARFGVTRRPLLRRAYALLEEQIGRSKVRVVLNAVKFDPVGPYPSMRGVPALARTELSS